MKAWDYEAVAYDGEVYCVGCIDDTNLNPEDISPIFASDEWDYAPTCCVCGAVHDYMNVLQEEE